MFSKKMIGTIVVVGLGIWLGTTVFPNVIPFGKK